MSKCETSFKIGDKVKLVASSYPDGSELDLDKGEYFIDHVLSEDPNPWAKWDDGSGVYTIDNENWNVTGSMLELVEDVLPTPKSMLKNFMRTINREGNVYLVGNDCIYSTDGGFNRLSNFGQDLTSTYSQYDIMSIYEPHQNVGFLLDATNLGKLVWQRESEEELEKKAQRESLKASMKVMQAELKVMKKQLEDMK